MKEPLTAKDLRLLSTFIRDLYVLRTHDEFSSHLVAALPSITEGDFTSYNEFPSNGNEGVVKSDQLPYIPNPAYYAGIINRYAGQHPFLTHLQKTKDGSAKMLSDFLTMREFRQTPLYHEFYKPLQIPYLALMALTVNRHTRITISRHRTGREFDEKTRTILNAIRPHVLQAFANAQAVTRSQEVLTSVTEALDQRGPAVMALTAHGTVLWATPRARALLLQYGLTYRAGSDRLPSPLREWIAARTKALGLADEPASPGTPLVLAQGPRQLHIRLMRDRDGHKLILAEQGEALGWEQLEALGLAHREAEVLAWVAQGKTNEEIGEILGCSRRTAQKHLERIYLKLGVENRTAAAAIAIEAARTSRTSSNSGP